MRIENGELIVQRSRHRRGDRSNVTHHELERLVGARLPFVELSDLLLEVDGWTGLLQRASARGRGPSRARRTLLIHSHASILAQACNLGLTRMAHVAGLSYEKLVLDARRWYLREETLRRRVRAHRELTSTGSHSARSVGDRRLFLLRRPAMGRAGADRAPRTASCIPRYFGYGRGVTAASTWTSDQFSQYGAKPSDGFHGAGGDLRPRRASSTTRPSSRSPSTRRIPTGYTDIVFALFDLLGLRFMPRLRDPGSRRLFRIDKTIRYSNIGPLLSGTIRPSIFLKQWDAMLRVTGSLKLGWVTSSLFLSKLQAREKRTEVAAALEEYGRLVRTIFLLQYVDDEALRRRIGKQLNKGEAMHALRRFLFLANQGQIRRAAYEEQLNQMSCLNVVTNAVVAWNTVYMHTVLEQLRAEGHTVNDDDVAHLSPARFEHINPYGKFRFDLSVARRGAVRRPLRRP